MIKSIHFIDFRCFQNFSMELKPGINLLIGDNASGKTSVLKGCKYILSSFFAGFSDENTRWICPEMSDFHEQIVDGNVLSENPLQIAFSFFNDKFPQIDGNELVLEGLSLVKNSRKKNSRPLTSGIKEYKNYSSNLQKSLYQQFESVKSRVCPLPLFACFSTEDIHSVRKLDKKRFTKYEQKHSFGYYECLEGDGFFPYWKQRLLVLQEGNKLTHEINAVRRAIQNVLGPEGCNVIQDISIRPNQKSIYYILTDGREVEATQLSDGYRRLVNIVTDIAIRCALLNHNVPNFNPLTDTTGTVLIDEIDMHLHPSMQSKVLQSLRYAFPKIQFIATTHAPMVMTGIENNENNAVFKLDYSSDVGYGISEVSTFGLDASTITELVLGQVPRDRGIQEELSRLFASIDEERIEDARQLLSALRQRFQEGYLPDLERAEMMLNFQMIDDDKNN